VKQKKRRRKRKKAVNRGYSVLWQPGVQKVGTTGTAGAGQTTFGWTKWDLDEKVTERNTNPPNSLTFNILHCPKHTGLFYQSNTP
jgi:hypothetical protein